MVVCAHRGLGDRNRTPAGRDQAGRLLTVEAAAKHMSAYVRFVRRLIAERRIEFIRLGRHVRISESALVLLATFASLRWVR